MTTLSAFTAFGLSPLLPLLLVHSGASQALAIQLASVRSVLAITARGLDFLLGKRGNPFVTCMIGLCLLLVSFVLLISFSPAMPAFIGFIAFFGFGAGVLTVSRAVLPLAVFSPHNMAFRLPASRFRKIWPLPLRRSFSPWHWIAAA